MNLKNTKDVKDVYNISTKLGAGTFGTVRLGEHKVTKQKRAIKNIFKNRTSKREEDQLANEMRILQEISHPNILPLVEYFETDTRVFIVTDIYEGGELFDEIIARGDFTDRDASLVINQLLSCLAYLAKKNIVHRDFKPENILLEKTKNLESIKVIDFGHAVEFDKNGSKPLTKRVGTPYYMAPELLKGKYGHKVDIWSVGVISYILLCGSPPFGGESNEEIFERVEAGKYQMEHNPWPEVSNSAKDFIKQILTVDPKERKEAKELLKHPFLMFRTKNNISKRNRNSKKKNAFQRLSTSLSNQASQSIDNLKTVMSKRSTKKKENEAVKNLKSFKCKQRLAQVAHAYVVTQCMPKNVKEDLAKVFRTWDKNNDGVLEKDEFLAAINELSPKVAKVFDAEHWFELMDQDCNGYIEYQEFLMMATDMKLMSKTNLLSVFNFLDKDGSGFLEVEELKAALTDIDDVDKAVQQMLQEADTDKDGKISLEEFLSLLSTS